MKTALFILVGICSAWPALAAEPVFDMHVHLHDGETSLRAYEAQIDEAGIALPAFGAMWFGGPNQVPPGDIAATRAGNDALIALAATRAGMIPIATVHPDDEAEAIAELERVAALGIGVLKLHPHTQRFAIDDPAVLPLVQRAGELGVVVMFDNASILPGDSEKLFNLALAAPDTQFVFAHMGGLNFRFWNVLALARTAEGLFAENIHFDISAMVLLAAGSPIADEFVWTMRNVGTGRLLLGSDFPQFTLAETLAALERLGLTEEEQAAIRYGNARALFGLN